MAHFYDSIPDPIARMTDAEAVERYADGGPIPGAVIRGLAPEQLNAVPVPGTWSIQQIVVHLMDTDLIAAYRMKRIIAEDRPRLDLYDENAFAARLHVDQLDAAACCELFRLNRLNVATLLRALPADAFARVALHAEIGEMFLRQSVRLYVHHLDHHLGFIRRKRAMIES